MSSAAVVLIAELAAIPQVTYARADARFVAIPLVRSRQNHLMVRAFINGKEAWLTIDSGAPVSAIAVNRRNHFRLKPVSEQVEPAGAHSDQRRVQQCRHRARAAARRADPDR